jgi:membrane-associated protein
MKQWIIVLMAVCCLTACTKKHSLEGEWKNKNGWEFDFDKDNKVTVKYDAAGKEDFKLSTGTYVFNENVKPATVTISNLSGQGYTSNIYGIVKFINGKTIQLQYDKTSAPTEFTCQPTSTFNNSRISLGSLLQPQFYLEHGGFWILMFIVFAETGLFAGFFLPGDSLLFVAGIYWKDISESVFNLPFFFIMLFITLAAIIGNMVGYWIGAKIGPSMFNWKDRWYFKKKHLIAAKEFYDSKGGFAIVIARFMPIVRTFAPIVAGIVQMDKKKFTYYSVVGAFAWVFSMMLIGRYLQAFLMSKFCYDLTHHIEFIVIGIVLVTTLPVIFKLLFGKKK